MDDNCVNPKKARKKDKENWTEERRLDDSWPDKSEVDRYFDDESNNVKQQKKYPFI